MKWSILILCFLSLACQKTIHERVPPKTGAFTVSEHEKKPTRLSRWALWRWKGEYQITHGVWIEGRAG